jgi:hypothetical protein
MSSNQNKTNTSKKTTHKKNKTVIRNCTDPIKRNLNPAAPIPIQTNSNSTISGLPNNGLITNIISALSGVFIFLIAPWAVNKLGNPTLAALVNVFPTGVLIALFINELEFATYYNKLLFAPMFNVVVNWIVYYFFIYLDWSPLSCIYLNLGIWATATLLSAFI